MLITAFYAPHTNLTSSSHTTQPVSTGFSEWTSVSPLCMPSRKALWKTSYWVFNSHAIDNEHSALVPWTYNLFDCRQLLPPTSRLVASMSGLAFISPLCIHASPLYFGGLDYRPHGSLATADTRTSVLLFYTLRPSNRHYFPSKSFSPSSQIQNSLGKKNLICGVHGHWILLGSRRID